MSGAALGEWFGDVSALQLRIAVVLALAGIAALALRRRASRVEHRVWTLALAAIVMLPIATSLLPALDVTTAAPAVASAPMPMAAPAEAVDGEIAWTWAEPATAVDAAPLPWRASVVALWALGAALLLAQVLVRLVGARVLVTGSTALSEDLAARIADAVGRSHAPIRMCDRLASPVVLGVARPVVLLPPQAASWSTERLRSVLVHELAHVAHGDHRWLVVADVARAIAWIDPLAWWAVARARRVAELAADDAVVTAGVDPHDYARELVEVARTSVGARHPAFAPSIVGRSRLPERIAALLLRGRPRDPLSTRVAVPLALGTLGAVASLAAVHLCDESRTLVRLGDDGNGELARAFTTPAIEPDPTRGNLVLLHGGAIELHAGGDPIRVPLGERQSIPDDQKQGHLVVALSDAFSSTALLVDADDRVPWATIVDVLYTAGRSGVRTYEFRRGDRWLSISPPMFPRDAEDEPARVRIAIDGARLGGTIATGGDPVALHSGDGCSLAPHVRAPDDDGVEPQLAVARRLCEITDGYYELTLAPGPSIAYGEITGTIARFVDVPGCRVDVQVESGDEGPIACVPGARALATFE